MTASADQYEWINEYSVSLALVENVDPAEALRRAVDRPVTDLSDVQDAVDWRGDDLFRRIMMAVPKGGWTLLVEDAGWQTTLAPTLVRLSAGTRVTSAHLHAENSRQSFHLAVHGVVRRDFDPLLYPRERPWAAWEGDPLPEESDLPFGGPLSFAAAVALMERVSGVGIEPFDVDEFNEADRLAVGFQPFG
jgi:hypothetical protein